MAPQLARPVVPQARPSGAGTEDALGRPAGQTPSGLPLPRAAALRTWICSAGPPLAPPAPPAAPRAPRVVPRAPRAVPQPGPPQLAWADSWQAPRAPSAASFVAQQPSHNIRAPFLGLATV